MIYNKFQELTLSALGMGCMRLPTQENGEIDVEATRRMIAYAMEKGINYYDTAWGYHGGQSEAVMGEILSAFPRSNFYLASKFPGYDLSNINKVEEIFEKQLEKCRVTYFDFYLFHNVCEMNIEQYLDPQYRIYDYLMQERRRGRIRHLGFSAHGNLDTLKRFLEAYGQDMEFCQLQINWLDWEFQNAKEKVELLRSYGIPIWVMEPVRGGSLATLKPTYLDMLKKFRPHDPAVKWAFRFLQSLPEVTLVLSGMSSMEQLRENIEIYGNRDPLSNAEKELLLHIGRMMTAKDALPCTGCRYCTTHCPKGLDIPWLIELYNEHNYSGGGFIAPMALDALAEDKRPAACLGCKACEAVCPQNIAVSNMMKDFASKTK